MTGPFKGLGDAALGMQQSIAQQNQQRVDNQRQQDALKVEQDRLKLAQEQAEQTRIDSLSNAMDKSLTYLTNNSKYLSKDITTQVGQMQAEWTDAQNKYYTTGDKSGLLAYQQKYPGNAIKVRIGNEERVYNLADLSREIQTNKPKVDFQETLDADFGRALSSTVTKALDDPTLGKDDKDLISQAMAGPGTPYEKMRSVAAVTSAITPQRALLNLQASGVPQDAKGIMALKGMVDGLAVRFPNDPYLQQLQAYYDPSVAPPEMKGVAEQGAALLKAGQEAAVSSAKLPTVTYRKELAGAQGAENDVNLQEQTFASAVAAANAVNGLKVTDAGYQTAAYAFATSLLPLKNKQDQIGVLANIAATPGLGKAFIDKMRNDPALSGLGISSDVWDSALTRANASTKAQTVSERLATARDTAALAQYGYAGITELRNAVEAGEIDDGTATALMDLAEAQDRLQRLGIQVGTATQGNELTRQTVISGSIEELTQMGINAERIKTRLGYQVDAYALKVVNGKLTLGADKAEAAMTLADFQQKYGASRNLIIVQDGAQKYLANLTDTQYQLLQSNASNELKASQENGLFVVQRTQLENQLGIATSQAGIQAQTNLYTAATAVANLVGPEAVSQYLASTTTNKATTQTQTNLLRQAEAAAPYMGKLGVANVLSQVAQGRMTEAQAREALQRSELIVPFLPKLIGQQVSAELAQGALTTATAKAALQNVNFLSLGTGLETMNAIASFGTWEEASKMPGFAAWAKNAGFTKPLFDQMRARQQELDKAKTQGKDSTNNTRIALNQSVTQAQKTYEATLEDEQYKRDIAFLQAVKDPKVDVDALMEAGFSINALQANMQYFGPEAKKVAQRILDYKQKVVAPAYQDWQSKRKAFDQWVTENTGTFNDTQGSSNSTSGGVYTAAPAVKGAIESAAQVAGVPAATFYGFIGAESTFNPNPQNYKGSDNVGLGQVGASAEADVNAMLKKQGKPTLDRSKPVENLQIAAHYLGMMMKKYPDPAMAYAAYNMGAGNFDAFLKRNGGKFDISKLPAETQTGIKNMKMYMGEYSGGGRPSQNVQLPPGGLTPAPGMAQQMKPGVDLTKFGITAINNSRSPSGDPISWCTKFVREYTEEANGLKDRALSGSYFGGTATETMGLFANKGALFLTDAPVSSAKAQVKNLKQGDVVFLNYGNDSLDHAAIYDGNGGFIQHSLPGFRGTTIQGAVNRMTTDEFFSKAGSPTVSFGRIPAQGQAAAAPKAAPVAAPKTPAAAPVAVKSTPAPKGPAKTPTPAKTPWQSGVPKPNFSFPDLTFEDAQLLYTQAQKVKSAAGQSNYDMTLRGLNQLGAELIAAGYNPAQVKRYVQQLTLGR